MADGVTMLKVGTLEDLKQAGHKVVHGPDRPIVVFYNDGAVCAVENRCPHMGFPLHRGTCVKGVITCPWHHARFDANSGCAYDTFAGDAAPFDVSVSEGNVFVSPASRKTDVLARARKRLREGLETANSLVIAKAVLTLRQHGADEDIVREVAQFGAQYRDDWGAGMTAFTSAVNLSQHLTDQTAFLALYQGATRVANDAQGQASRRARYALENDDIGLARLRELMADWVDARHRDGAERTLLTAIRNNIGPAGLSSFLLEAGTRRVYSDTGHVVDFCNKAIELIERVGVDNAGHILPVVLSRLLSASGGEEQTSWMAPDDLIALVGSLSDLEGMVAGNDGSKFSSMDSLASSILTSNANDIAASLRTAAKDGASAVQLAQAVAYAAAVRVAQFHTANEFNDWFTVLHSFSYCHAVHAMLRRSGDAVGLAAVVHGAYTVFLSRFLNVPALKLPAIESVEVAEPEKLLADLLESFEGRAEGDAAGIIVSKYYDAGLPISRLIDTLAVAVLREDFDFHTLQMLDAAVAEMAYWPAGKQQRTLLIAAARYIAAFSPTRRTQFQTARIALRLHRGEEMFSESELV